MKQVDLAELEMSLYVQLRVLRGTTKTSLQHLNSDLACKTVARLLIERCLSGFAMFAPDHYYHRSAANEFGSLHHGDPRRAGTFGKTEPWPLPPLEPPSSDRCRLCTANNIDALGEEMAKAMWSALMPAVDWDKAGEHRASFLLIAHHGINWLDRGGGGTDTRPALR